MKITYLGTCSGTEPMPGMHQTSTAFEVGGQLYMIDAGECCGYTAHTLGLDLLRLRAVFITHPHIDHIGGLPHLLFIPEKLYSRGYGNFIPEKLSIVEPEKGIAEAAIWFNVRSGRNFSFEIEPLPVFDGKVYSDDNITVIAHHNYHMRETENFHSYSYLVLAGDKRILFSGDVRSVYDLDPLADAGIDLLVMETGHHSVSDVLDYAKKKKIGALRFIHHGREIINGRAAAEKKVNDFSLAEGIDIRIAYDGMSEEL